MTTREIIYVAIMLALAIQLGRDMLRLYRWSPSLFRGGPVVLRDSRPLTRLPDAIPVTGMRTPLGYPARYKAFSKHEVAFTVQTFTAPCLFGRLIVDVGGPSLALTARLNWSVYAVFVVGFALAHFPWFVFPGIAAMFGINYLWDVRECKRLFTRVAEAIDDGSADQES